jgi:hypothetical protein
MRTLAGERILKRTCKRMPGLFPKQLSWFCTSFGFSSEFGKDKKGGQNSYEINVVVPWVPGASVISNYAQLPAVVFRHTDYQQ